MKTSIDVVTEETQPPRLAELPTKQRYADLLIKLSPTLLWAVFFGLFFSVPGSGFMVLFIIIPQTILIPVRLYRCVVNPLVRWLSLGQVVIWLVTIASIFLVHYVRDDINRKYANAVVARLVAYSAAHGKCAEHIEDVGISTQELHGNLGYSGYFCKDGEQHFFHRGSFMPFSSWSYNFKNHEWHYRSD